MNKDLAEPSRATFLLIRRSIEDACADGCHYYHMGESGNSASLAYFKEGFCREPIAMRNITWSGFHSLNWSRGRETWRAGLRGSGMLSQTRRRLLRPPMSRRPSPWDDGLNTDGVTCASIEMLKYRFMIP